jgi:hypothetical protein
MQSCLLFISLLLSVLTSRLYAQTTFPADGESIRYTAYIEHRINTEKHGYVSGICILHRDGDTVHGSLFNEFGITALDFTYRLERKKVKLHKVMPMMNKWYIRKVLKKDLRQLMTGLQNGETTWKDERYHIEYQLTPLL